MRKIVLFACLVYAVATYAPIANAQSGRNYHSLEELGVKKYGGCIAVETKDHPDMFVFNCGNPDYNDFPSALAEFAEDKGVTIQFATLTHQDGSTRYFLVVTKKPLQCEVTVKPNE